MAIDLLKRAEKGSALSATDYDDTLTLIEVEVNGLPSVYQPLDSDLTAVAGLAANGLVARTATGTMAARTVTAGSAKITVSNGNGVSGNPTVDLGTVAQGDITNLMTDLAAKAPLASPAFTGNPTEQYFDAGTKQGAVTIDYTQGAWQSFVTGTGNITSVAISNTPASGRVAQITLEITQGATPRTIAWGASFRFPGGTAHALTATASAIDIFTLVTRNGGTNWFVFDSGKAWA